MGHWRAEYVKHFLVETVVNKKNSLIALGKTQFPVFFPAFKINQ